jgi:hypothetical protein
LGALLEYLKIKKWSMFLGVALARHERPMEENGASLAMLEGAGTIEVGGRLQKCMFRVDEDRLVTRVD